jgi:ABC-type molybdenum transport system ATPase subunit/photorepair protein PhrA
MPDLSMPSLEAAAMDTPPASSPLSPPVTLRMEGVSLCRGDASVLEEASLEVDRGALLLLTGARGAGKSSLLAVAAGR